MFSNIIGQEAAADTLRCEVKSNTLANTMLFHGKSYTGKLTAALELVRVLNCNDDKSKNCKCDSCRKMRTLDFNGFLLLSRRNYYYQTVELINSYKKNKSAILRDKIYQNIKLSFLPLQSFLLDGAMSEADKKNVMSYGEKLNDFIDNPEYNSVNLEVIENIMNSLTSLYKTSNIPVNLIRNMLNWTYFSLDVKARVVIIDKVDYLETSSENILLKRLEEPSSNLYFILLAENKNKIIQTIKSRCRSYYFQDLSKESVNYIITHQYENEEKYESLYDFFHTSDPAYSKNIQNKLSKLVSLVFNKNHNFSELYLFMEAEKDKNQILSLITELRYIIEKELLHREYSSGKSLNFPILSNVSTQNLEFIASYLKEIYDRITIFNLSAKNQLEGLLFPIKEMVLNGKI